jgi:hypothetical protein
MSSYDITLSREHATVDDDPIEVWTATVENADAYGEAKGKTPGDALRRLGDEFDVEFGATPRGNWSDHEDVRVGR